MKECTNCNHIQDLHSNVVGCYATKNKAEGRYGTNGYPEIPYEVKCECNAFSV